MDFDRFHYAAEQALNRAVYSHEFAHPERLLAEYHGDLPEQSIDDIPALIPEEKLVSVTTEQIEDESFMQFLISTLGCNDNEESNID